MPVLVALGSNVDILSTSDLHICNTESHQGLETSRPGLGDRLRKDLIVTTAFASAAIYAKCGTISQCSCLRFAATAARL